MRAYVREEDGELRAQRLAEHLEERVDVVTAAVRRQLPRGRVLLGQQSPPVEERIDEVVATGLRRRRASRRRVFQAAFGFLKCSPFQWLEAAGRPPAAPRRASPRR